MMDYVIVTQVSPGSGTEFRRLWSTATAEAAHPKDAPLIDPVFFSDPLDLQVLLKRMQKGFDAMQASALTSIRGKML